MRKIHFVYRTRYILSIWQMKKIKNRRNTKGCINQITLL